MEDKKENNKNKEGNLPISDVIWRSFNKELPEPYKNVEIKTDEKIIKTRTYIHSGKLMLK